MYIKINGKKVSAKPEQTILEAAHGIVAIPTLCHHPDLKVKANCRVCLVELKNGKLVTACSTKVKDGMEVFTDTEKVKRARKINLEMIFAEHEEKCPECIWDKNCSLQDYAKKYQGKITRFKDRKKNRNIFGFSNTILFDQTKCIDCNNCIEVCHKQEVHFYDKAGKGADSIVLPTKNKKYDCTTCGQCITHCPVGAIQGNPHWPEVEASLKDKKKIVVAQVAPSVRASIGEEFGYEPGTVVTGELVSALKKLGFDYVFDTNFGADITTFEEAGECFECLGKGKMVTTSCCPAWVKFVEFNYPEFVGNISTTKSPQQCLGVAVKTYFAEKMKIDPRKIKVVSIMPCVAKKFEADRPELEYNNMKMVDYVLTTREVAHMMRRAKIDFTKMKPQKFDDPLGQSSGAAAIYGVSGGVMESALRTALDYYAGQKLKSIDFKQIRGLEGTKKAEIMVKGKKVKIIVTSGLGNAKKVMDLIKAGKENPHFLEVMACPGGCINGGGQPVPTNAQIRAKRAAPLYVLDKKSKFRKAHDNPGLKKLYKEYIDKHPDLHHEMFHTSNYRQKRWGARRLN
ncbi:MAG: [FeFe] hydrogenase, group A [Patescibacteria group bacterium]|jgi:NADH-quinone oxidoreductase subunit G/NADP-reducing hydrogenase subunit HndD